MVQFKKGIKGAIEVFCVCVCGVAYECHDSNISLMNAFYKPSFAYILQNLSTITKERGREFIVPHSTLSPSTTNNYTLNNNCATSFLFSF